jgi:hypothetical protein
VAALLQRARDLLHPVRKAKREAWSRPE